jgi:hypothetical protein
MFAAIWYFLSWATKSSSCIIEVIEVQTNRLATKPDPQIRLDHEYTRRINKAKCQENHYNIVEAMAHTSVVKLCILSQMVSFSSQ